MEIQDPYHAMIDLRTLSPDFDWAPLNAYLDAVGVADIIADCPDVMGYEPIQCMNCGNVPIVPWFDLCHDCASDEEPCDHKFGRIIRTVYPTNGNPSYHDVACLGCGEILFADEDETAARVKAEEAATRCTHCGGMLVNTGAIDQPLECGDCGKSAPMA